MINKKLTVATLSLFNSVQVASYSKFEFDELVLEHTLKHGYILNPAIAANAEIFKIIEDIVGISGEKANAAFHKSWAKIKNTPTETLVIQQILHYITTYGYQNMNIFSHETIYIPTEKLELPELNTDLPIVSIKAITKDDLLAKISKLGSGIALQEQTLKHIMTIIEENKYDKSFVEAIANRELKAKLYDYYGIVPTEPVEFLRHLVSKLTDESLLIKNDYLIDKIKESNGKFLDELIKDAPSNLASIFYRYKPLFLAMKKISKNKTFFNRLRKDAIKMHKPLPIDYLNSITQQIKADTLDLAKLENRLKKATIFRKIRLVHSLNYRANPAKSILFKIRNGKGFVTQYEAVNLPATKLAYDLVMSSIVEHIKPKVKNKTIYIPNNIEYALPASEKQFTGFLPSGTYATLSDNMVIGNHWVNIVNEGIEQQIDLDLSLIGISGKTGWDGEYKTDNNQILFSGDLTDAPIPLGASELFYIDKNLNEPKILMLNYYNFMKGNKVDTIIMLAQDKITSFEKHYLIDPNKMILSTTVNISQPQNILGLIHKVDGELRFYFNNLSLGLSITSSNNEHSLMAQEYFLKSLENSISFKEILSAAGAIIVKDRPTDSETEYLDLSPNALDKNSFLDLLQ